MNALQRMFRPLKAAGSWIQARVRGAGNVVRDWFRDGLGITRRPPPPPPPPPPPRVRLPRLEPRPTPRLDSNAVERVKLAVDLGTSSCAVAMPAQGNARPYFATLSVAADKPYSPQITIGSAIYIDEDGTTLVMDDAWIGRYIAKANKTGGVTYRSVKRELFEHYHLQATERQRLHHRLALIYEELLWLALDPAMSSTVQALMKAGLTEVAEAWTQKGGFAGITLDERSVKAAVTIDGFDVCICAPNSLMPKDVEVLVGAARLAAESVLERLREGEQFDAPPPVVTPIREAEAVAWALPAHDLDLHGDVVIVDVGAGTTDAALVHYGRTVAGVPTHLVEYRTGSPFGGDDLDMLLLCEAWSAAADEPPHGLTVTKPGDFSRVERSDTVRRVREKKEEWVRGAGDESVIVVVADDHAPVITVSESRNIDVPILTTNTTGARTLDYASTLTDPPSRQTYASFLRYTAFLSCAALFRRLRGHDVSAIILTGQGSLALGIRPYVVALASEYSLNVPENRIRHLDRTTSQAMKLVCAEGAAIYISEVDPQPRRLGDVVPETFVLYHDRALTDLFPAGSRSQRQDVNAMIVVEHPGVRRHILRYYCSPQDLPATDLAHDWARKTIGTIKGGDGQRDALAFRLDLRKERINVWQRSERRHITPLPFSGSPELRGPKPKHPFLRIGNEALPLTWQSTG